MAKVLIIEDDEVIARGMARHLETAGFDAVGVANGETGLARLRYERPDVCVLDLMLPGIDGWRVIEQARDEGIGTPIIVVSARGTEHDRVHALEIGADDYLVKPFGRAELLARIAAVMRRAERSVGPPSGTVEGEGATSTLEAGGLILDLGRHEARVGDTRSASAITSPAAPYNPTSPTGAHSHAARASAPNTPTRAEPTSAATAAASTRTDIATAATSADRCRVMPRTNGADG